MLRLNDPWGAICCGAIIVTPRNSLLQALNDVRRADDREAQITETDILNDKDDRGINMGQPVDQKDTYLVGVISDTHGLLRSEVLLSFENVDLVLHAGDIGDSKVLEDLHKIAPVTAVRGNMDYGSWAWDLPEFRRVKLGNTEIFLVHDLFGIHFGGAENGVHVVISGHTHRPKIDMRNDILFMNPGSAGYRSRLNPVSVGLLSIENGQLDAKIIALDV